MRKCGFVYENNEIRTKFDGVTSYDTKKYRLIISDNMQYDFELKSFLLE